MQDATATNGPYPWAKTKVGASFLVPLGNQPIERIRNRVTAAAAMRRKRHGDQFRTQTVKGGVRVTRIA